MVKKTVRALGASLIVGSIVSLYTTFVIQNLWNWFAAPAFHVSEISFWGTYGLILLLSLLSDSGRKTEDEHNWKLLWIVLDSCVPDEKREWLKDQLDDHEQGIWQSFWVEGASLVFGKAVGNTFALGLGWAVHTFLAAL